MRRLVIPPLWLSAMLIACASAQAAEPQATAEAAGPQAEPVAAGQIVTIDPVTGKMRAATAAERLQLQQQSPSLKSARRATPQLAGKKGFAAPQTQSEALGTRRRLGNGGTAMQVPESYMSDLTVTTDANGTMHIQHSDDGLPAAAEKPTTRMEASDE
ncbi:post-PEP-CTERM-1 domain-containing protein [Pseudoxanthomonas dokdonensis]|uniref:Lipoprotein n=1 Tax=Pseudoxanthomonas dokdonensis TaxID=344882 RepID=A0A0R0CRN0_9GAMM|nr:hypothetical protein [Pseudoxanthomonas dokdonensis]KRG68337.1 hypothetical protein ABB29_13540 [Pseudoxanthomonas dokdonensis]